MVFGGVGVMPPQVGEHYTISASPIFEL